MGNFQTALSLEGAFYIASRHQKRTVPSGAIFISKKVGGAMEPQVNGILSDIRERMVRVETKIDSMTDLQNTANDAKDTATQALSSTRSAHKRLDKIDKIIFWLGTTVIGSVVTGAITLLLWRG